MSTLLDILNTVVKIFYHTDFQNRSLRPRHHDGRHLYVIFNELGVLSDIMIFPDVS